MQLLYESEGRVRLEADNDRKVFLARWQVLCGEHYRAACEALLASAARHGIETYISDPHAATDVQRQEDLQYAAEVVGQLIALGCKRFLVVSPHSAVTRMATNRMGRVVDGIGVERHVVATLDEALRMALRPPDGGS